MLDSRFDALSERLLREGISPRHVRRTVFELKGHFEDIVAELQASGLPQEQCRLEASRRLGSDDVIVSSMAAHPELKSRVRRWPWLAFGFFPIVLFIALLALSSAPLVVVATIARQYFVMDPQWGALIQKLGSSAMFLILCAVPLIAAGACCVIAESRRARRLWPITAVVIVALLGAATNASFVWPTDGTQGQLGAGFGFSTETLMQYSLRALVTMTVVLIPYFLYQRQRAVL